ncbi:MAG: hypothetical protein ACJAQT_001755 [Akkermansiaceae bacterium]|jgi:hypothetical protein
MTQFSEVIAYLSCPEKGTFLVDYVNEADEFSIALGHFTRWFFEAIAIHIEQLTLTPN